MKIILISGKAQHGKDTSAKLMKEVLSQEGTTVIILHYADLLKFICRSYFNWDGQKDVEGRTLLQTVGEQVRQRNYDFWVNYMVQFLQVFQDQWDYVLIPDTRYSNEIDVIKQNFGDVVHMRVCRPNFDNGLTLEQKQHISETALDDVEPDYWIQNDSDLASLKSKIQHLLSCL